MTPDEAISDIAREAMHMLETVRQQKDKDPNLISLLYLITAAVESARGAMDAEFADPGALSSADKEQLWSELRLVATGAAVLFALAPGVKDLPAPVLH